jgi:type VI secretion system secreted protein VgrG
MSESFSIFDNRPMRLSGAYKDQNIRLKSGVVEEGINMLTSITVEFVAKNHRLDLNGVVGYDMAVEIDAAGGDTRLFKGTCISAEYLGLYRTFALFTAEVRPWAWFLTRRRNSRAFQGKTAPEIIQTILRDAGFSSDYELSLSGTYPARDFCLQYRETDLDFITRLMEEEGIYYFFRAGSGREKMVVADGPQAHVATVVNPVEFTQRSTDYRSTTEHIYEMSGGEASQSGKVTLWDYNFETPSSELRAVRAIAKGGHGQTGHEIYDYPGLFGTQDRGEALAKVRMEAEAARHGTWRGAGTIRTLSAGETFKTRNHPPTEAKAGFMITRARHAFMIEHDPQGPDALRSVSRAALRFDFGPHELYRVTFDAVDKDLPFRAPAVTPRPEIAGVQTAIVTGPSGEEIHTDKYGRVKIQFHWDREGQVDENSSVFVRCMTPWSGKNWGMIHIPRIGQEVVVSFEEGNPDRPLIMGMLYNAETMPPYALPANKTQSGIMTRSSKSGSADTYNELMFEDLKDNELVRFQAEKDYQQIVKNNALITVGLEKKDPGDMVVTIHHNLTETVKTGDHTFKIETGSQIIETKTDRTETVEGKSTLTVTGDVTETVKEGNVSETVKMGNVSHEVSMGNEKVDIKMGNYALKCDLGKIEMEAMQSIELKVGSNSIKIDQVGVTITGMIVKVEGTAMLEAKSPMTQVKGDALLILKGGLTMIN